MAVSVTFAMYNYCIAEESDEFHEINELAKTKHLSRQETVDLIGHLVSFEAMLSENQYLREQTYTDLMDQIFRGRETSSGFDFLSNPATLIEYLYLALQSDNKDTLKSALEVVVTLTWSMGIHKIATIDKGDTERKSRPLFIEYDKSQINAVLYKISKDGSNRKNQHYAIDSLLQQNKNNTETFSLVEEVLTMETDEVLIEQALRTVYFIIIVDYYRENRVKLSTNILTEVYSHFHSGTSSSRSPSFAKSILIHYRSPETVSILLNGAFKSPTDKVYVKNLTILMLHDKKMVAGNPVSYNLEMIAVSDIARDKYNSFSNWLENR